MSAKNNFIEQPLLAWSMLVVSMSLLWLLTFQIRPASTLEAPAFLYAPPETIRHFTFGYDESMADSLWLRVIQDMDHCEQVQDAATKANVTKPGLASAATVAGEASSVPEQRRLSSSKCQRGWVFQMLNLVTELAPKFRMPYIMGATLLSVAIEDKEGAQIIFRKGVERFDDDWSMPFRAAYHEIYEMKDSARAAEYLQIAGARGAPAWVYSLAAKLYTDIGRAEFAKTILEGALKQNTQGIGYDRIRKRLDEVNRVLAGATRNN